jgi:A/G-specific adenine glycosylase
LLNKRGAKDIWENLYEFPLFESDRTLDVSEVLELPDFISSFGDEVTVLSVYGPMKHQLSHQTIYAQFIVIEPNTVERGNGMGWQFIPLKDLNKLAQPKIIFSFLGNFLH